MVTAPFRLIGAGVYSLPDAARLTGIPRRRIRRWLEGYSFQSSGKVHHSPAVIATTLRRDVGQLALTFSDLIEIRFLDRFLECGVKWHVIRVAARRASELLGRPRPFSTQIFKTDGHAILAQIVRSGDDPELLNLVTNQWELDRIVDPMLYAGLDFNALDEPERWWPMGQQKSVVIDPLRAFGAPILARSGVPTQVVARAVRTERSHQFVARMYDLALKAVRHAVEYETRFLA